MDREASSIAFISREPSIIYDNVNENLRKKITAHIDELKIHSDADFVYNEVKYRSARLDIPSSAISDLESKILKIYKTFYSVITSLDITALALIFISVNKIVTRDLLRFRLFEIQKIYPYYQSYYSLNEKTEIKNDSSQFCNFCLSLIEHIETCFNLIYGDLH